MTTDWDDDDRFLEALGDAVRAGAETPSRIGDLGRELFVWRTVDAELAELVDDAAEPAALVRDGAFDEQGMTFRASGLEVHVDVDRGSAAVRGQVVRSTGRPPSQVVVEGPGFDPVTAAVDDVGFFSTRLPDGAGRFRLRIGSVVTPFVG